MWFDSDKRSVRRGLDARRPSREVRSAVVERRVRTFASGESSDAQGGGDQLTMDDDDVRAEVMEQLREALEAEDAADKDFYVRQALQFLEMDDDS